MVHHTSILSDAEMVNKVLVILVLSVDHVCMVHHTSILSDAEMVSKVFVILVSDAEMMSNSCAMQKRS